MTHDYSFNFMLKTIIDDCGFNITKKTSTQVDVDVMENH